MLTERELAFISYWEKNREDLNSASAKFLGGLPFAALFGLPILFFIAVVYFFFPDWYQKISDTSQNTFLVIVIAVLIFIVVFGYIRKHFKWEMNEQLYQELKSKQKQQISS